MTQSTQPPTSTSHNVSDDKLQGSEGVGASRQSHPTRKLQQEGESAQPCESRTAANGAISQGSSDPGSHEPPSLPSFADAAENVEPCPLCADTKLVPGLGTECMACREEADLPQAVPSVKPTPEQVETAIVEWWNAKGAVLGRAIDDDLWSAFQDAEEKLSVIACRIVEEQS